MKVYVVSSCRLDISTGNVSVLVLRGYNTPEAADAWIEKETKRDLSFNEDEDWYEVDEITIYEE